MSRLPLRPFRSCFLVVNLTILSYLLVVLLSQASSATAAAQQPTGFAFTQAAPQGFGDRQNSYAWAMTWWRGHLYVATGRSTQCVQHATGALFYPMFVTYPPTDPDIECTPSPQDLPLRAEVWRWSPTDGSWQMVFQSPEDVPIPGFPGKFVARDIGFRSMIVFTEPDGTEALYLGGVSSNSFNPDVPPPRILRSVDGVHFAPIPQAPGTFLGNIEATSFRSLTAFEGKLFVIATVGFAGFGNVLVSDNPAGGNDNFQLALSPEITAFELSPFNNSLYIGTGDSIFAWPPDFNTPPFAVLRTAAASTPPYTTTTVIPEGGYRPNTPSRSVVSLYEFQNQLYVGTDRPAELYRVAADDSWDLIVGSPRWTPVGIKYPLSGMDTGFDNSNNIHIWRMHEYRNQLLVGTMDQSTKWRNVPILGEMLAPTMGFDLYMTDNGQDFVMLTRNGFNDIFDVGLRNFAITPQGLFFGTANHYYGTKIWFSPYFSGEARSIYLPLIMRPEAGQLFDSTTAWSTTPSMPPVTNSMIAPDEVVVGATADHALLSWQTVAAANQYQIWRAAFIRASAIMEGVEPELVIPQPFQMVATTELTTFVDDTVQTGPVYHYYVVAENGDAVSEPSQLVHFPPLTLTNPVSLLNQP